MKHRITRALPAVLATSTLAGAAHATVAAPIPEPSGIAIFALAAAVVAVAIRWMRRR